MKSNVIIQVDCMIDQKVYKDFCNFNSFTVGRRWLTMVLADILLIMFAVINWYTKAPLLTVVCGGMAVLFPVLYLIWYRISVSGQIRRFGLETPKYFYSVKLTPEGISVHNEKENTSFTWKQTYRVYEMDSYFYIFITKARGYIVPKKNIICGTEDILRSIVKENLPEIRYIDKRKSNVRSKI